MTDLLYRIATTLIPITIAIVFHEVAHGFAARHFGDNTAARMGRLSLNPLKHVDPIGTVALPMMLAVAGAPIFGWAKPVPVNQRGLRNPRWHMVLVALAGPGMNIVLAALTVLAMAAMLLTVGPQSTPLTGFVWENLSNFAVINVMLAIFNLLPLPPFDGSHVVEGVLPRPLAARFARMRRYGLLLVIFLFVVVPVIAPKSDPVGTLIGPPVAWALGLISQLLTLLTVRG